MELPEYIWDTWKAVADKFKVLHQGTEDQRREATKRGVQTIRARHGVEGSHYVCKSQHNTGWEAASKDAIAFVKSPVHGAVLPMIVWDMINGTTRETNEHPIEGHESSAYVLIPDPYDWLEGDEVDEPDEPDAPDNSQLEARVRILEAKMNNLMGEFGFRSMKNGKAVCTDDGDVLKANRDNIDQWEKYKFEF